MEETVGIVRSCLRPVFSAAALIDALLRLKVASRMSLAQSIAILMLAVSAIAPVDWKPTALAIAPSQTYRFVDALLLELDQKSSSDNVTVAVTDTVVNEGTLSAR